MVYSELLNKMILKITYLTRTIEDRDLTIENLENDLKEEKSYHTNVSRYLVY